MDARQLAFIDEIEADLTAPKSRSTVTAKRIGAFGAMLAAGSAFFVLSAAPASAAPASAAPVATRPSDVVQLKRDCFTPVAVNSDYTKDCNSGAFVNFTFLAEYACGPGGQKSIYRFARTYFSICTGWVALPDAQTPCV